MTVYTWCSFANEEGFLGVCIVEADNVIEAAMRAHELGINPGGEVLGATFSIDDNLPAELVGVLHATLEEASAFDEACASHVTEAKGLAYERADKGDPR